MYSDSDNAACREATHLFNTHSHQYARSSIIDIAARYPDMWHKRHPLLASLALGWLLVLAPITVIAGGLEVLTLDGRKSSLGEQIAPGKWTLVMAWTTYCEVCRTQYPTISEFHTQHHTQDATVLGVALDGYADAAKVVDYRVSQRHSFPSVLAESETFAEGFARAAGEAFTGTPTYLLFDADGKLQAYLSGPVDLTTLERAIRP